jgi:hypothetical protein
VTKWSKLDISWKGVSVDTLLEAMQSEAGYLTATRETDLAARQGAGGRTRDLPHEQHRARAAGLVGSSGGPTRRRAPDRRGRIPSAAQTRSPRAPKTQSLS